MFPHHAEGGLVYGIYIGPFFAADLDVDEQLVHDRGGAAFLETFVAITWHQWQAAYPTDKSVGLSSSLAARKVALPQAHQWTGLSSC